MITLKYSIENFTDYEQTLIHETLNDPRGWSSLGYKFVKRVKNYDFIIKKKTKDEIKKQINDKRLYNLSVTFKGIFKTPEIWINNENWIKPPKNFTGNRKTYRQYLIQHEAGHVLGYGHKSYKENKNCPVMYQQTKGTTHCNPNPWIKYEN